MDGRAFRMQLWRQKPVAHVFSGEELHGDEWQMGPYCGSKGVSSLVARHQYHPSISGPARASMNPKQRSATFTMMAVESLRALPSHKIPSHWGWGGRWCSSVRTGAPPLRGRASLASRPHLRCGSSSLSLLLWAFGSCIC